MTGLLFLIIVVIAIISTIGWIFLPDDNWDDDLNLVSSVVAVIFWIITALFLLSIPISRLDSKAEVKKIEIFQAVVDHNRTMLTDDRQVNMNAVERFEIIQQIDCYNSKIVNWKTKGQKWYQNKWWYHPSTKTAKYVK